MFDGVVIENPTKTAKVEARIPQRERRQIETRAQELGMNVSEFTRAALRAFLSIQHKGGEL
jgi:ribosomal protein L32E